VLRSPADYHSRWRATQFWAPGLFEMKTLRDTLTECFPPRVTAV